MPSSIDDDKCNNYSNGGIKLTIVLKIISNV